MSDLISRQAAVDALCKSECGWNNAKYVLKVIRRLQGEKYTYLRLPAADKVSELRNEMQEE